MPVKAKPIKLSEEEKVRIKEQKTKEAEYKRVFKLLKAKDVIKRQEGKSHVSLLHEV